MAERRFGQLKVPELDSPRIEVPELSSAAFRLTLNTDHLVVLLMSSQTDVILLGRLL